MQNNIVISRSVEVYSVCMDLQLESFSIFLDTGFLPDKPSIPLQDDCFCEWEKVAKSIYHLIKEKRVVKAVNDLPNIEHSLKSLHAEDQWHRAYAVTSFIAQAYLCEVVGTAETAAIRLPSKIAIPWHKTAEFVGVPPVVTYSALVFYNYIHTVSDYNSKAYSLDNLEIALSFTGSREESNFAMVHALEEIAAAPGLQAIVSAYKAIMQNDKKSLTKCLNVIAEALQNMKNTLGKMHLHCSTDFFYFTLRPLFSFPEHGVIYEGISPDIKHYRSVSGAQDSAIPAFSIFLGIKHGKEEQDVLDDFMLYMPAKHRKFLLDLKKQPSVKAYVQQSGDSELMRCYDETTHALEAFRTEHIKLVTRYIINPRRLRSQVTTDEDKGTGGTPFMRFLKNVREDTKLI